MFTWSEKTLKENKDVTFDPSNERSLEDYRLDLEDYIQMRGPFTHNLISITLRSVGREFGAKVANQLVKDFDLTKKFNIRQKL